MNTWDLYGPLKPDVESAITHAFELGVNAGLQHVSLATMRVSLKLTDKFKSASGEKPE